MATKKKAKRGAAGIQAAQAKLAQLRAEGKKRRVLTPTERSERAPGSLKLAIASMCYHCQGEDADPGWQWRIGNCEVTICPLMGHRPYQKLEGAPMPWRLRTQEEAD